VRLSQLIALEMRLSSKCIDDIRVAALMHGFSTIEITTKVISRAVHSLEAKGNTGAFSFHGTDLVHSLGAVLHGAIPILVNQDHVLLAELQQRTPTDVPIGAQILRVAQAFDSLTMGRAGDNVTPQEAIHELRANVTAAYDVDVLDVLERVVAEQRELVHV
jgi:response regulator RpfG family c-di-GMP phosphodiesterase